MRLAFVAALLISCFCSQGCLSFFYYGKTSDRRAAALKQRSVNTGVLSGALYVLGSACLAAGIANNQDGGEQVFFTLEAGTAMNMLGGVLTVGASALGILSLIWGRAHHRQRNRYGGRGEDDEWDSLRRRYGIVHHPRAGPMKKPGGTVCASMAERRKLQAHRYMEIGGLRVLRD
ncbi:MAG: hypothetical protein ACYTFG_16100 [Planctomycetota bacterium]|jgi:hypothetical protein